MRRNHSVLNKRNDLTFFTNEPDATLLDRFKATLKHVQFFDVLVGYFRTSGFRMMAESLDSAEKIRILVGLNVDRQTFETVEEERTQRALIESASKQVRTAFCESIVEELEHAPDTHETESGVRSFLEFLQAGKLEIKAHPSQKIHAKLYIQRFREDDRDFGRIITGSSNFSYSGLQGNYEFNVELKQSSDVQFALEKFEGLWAEGIDVSEQYAETVKRNTWLNDEITPRLLYLKLLYEYFKEELNFDDKIEFWLPDNFMALAYQSRAVQNALRVLETYRGVFLADVVGLGKTFISALLAQQLPGRKLVICPPVLVDYWRETFRDFGVRSFQVESIGKLDQILQRAQHQKVDYLFIDEAHRFRNEMTQRYEQLAQICAGKKVILVSATPLNNRIEDISAS
jgi:HKD family nuclease